MAWILAASTLALSCIGCLDHGTVGVMETRCTPPNGMTCADSTGVLTRETDDVFTGEVTSDLSNDFEFETCWGVGIGKPDYAFAFNVCDTGVFEITPEQQVNGGLGFYHTCGGCGDPEMKGACSSSWQTGTSSRALFEAGSTVLIVFDGEPGGFGFRIRWDGESFW